MFNRQCYAHSSPREVLILFCLTETYRISGSARKGGTLEREMVGVKNTHLNGVDR